MVNHIIAPKNVSVNEYCNIFKHFRVEIFSFFAHILSYFLEKSNKKRKNVHANYTKSKKQPGNAAKKAANRR